MSAKKETLICCDAALADGSADGLVDESVDTDATAYHNNPSDAAGHYGENNIRH